jgi:hypothetical protein
MVEHHEEYRQATQHIDSCDTAREQNAAAG